MLLSKATVLTGDNNLNALPDLLYQSENNIILVEQDIDELLTKYFQDFTKWKDMELMALKWSYQHKDVTILIDKFGRKCFVLEKGNIVKTYPVEMGSNWIGDKMKMGNQSTPEGNYKILKKKKDSETRYNKALLLDYPNEED